jgi:hypothetical protein
MIKVRCSTCGARLKAPDAAAGKPLDCPHCAQVVPVPAQATLPPPTVAGPGESSHYDGRITIRPKPPRKPTFDELADEIEERRKHRLEDAVVEDASEADLPGAISLGLALTSTLCLLAGCFTCGLTYWVAAPIAAAGAGCAAFSHSRLRLSGLAFNLVVMIPAVIAFRAALMAATAPASEMQPFVR